jgi:hypothetical protein
LPTRGNKNLDNVRVQAALAQLSQITVITHPCFEEHTTGTYKLFKTAKEHSCIYTGYTYIQQNG